VALLGYFRGQLRVDQLESGITCRTKLGNFGRFSSLKDIDEPDEFFLMTIDNGFVVIIDGD